jgi:hypothetical protein
MGLNFPSSVALKKWGHFIIIQKVTLYLCDCNICRMLARHYNVSPLVRCAVLSQPCHFIQGFHLSSAFDWLKSKEVTVCTQMQGKVFPLNM